MAIMPSQTKPAAILDSKYTGPAAIVSIVLALGGIAAIVTAAVVFKDISAGAITYLAGWVVLLVVVISAGVQLMRKNAWGQRFSLLYHLALTIAAVITMVSITLRGLAQWWPGELDPTVIFVPVIITSAVAAVLLIQASVAGSRLRYASVVMTTVASVIALTVVANLIAQTDYVNVNLASYGRYGISKRTERILQSLDTPVRLTCAYNISNISDENKKISSEYAPRTLELLRDMADCSENVQAVNASTDSAKARVIARLRGSIGGKADEHIKFLDTFTSQSKTIADTLDLKHRQWRQVSAAYLDLWGMTARITRIFEVLADETRKTHKKIDGQIGGSGLPDYAALAKDAEKSLTDSDKTLREISAFLKQLSTIGPKVRANKKSVLKKTGKCLDAALKMSSIVGKPSEDEPSNPSAVLKKFITAARKTSKLASDTAKELAAIAGKENASLIQNSNVWQIRLPTSNSGMMIRTTLSDLYSILAKTIDRRILDAEGLVKAAKPEYQAEVIVKMRKEIAQLAKSFSQSHDKVQSAALALCRIDPQSEKIFQQARTDTITADLLKPIGMMLIQAQRLPKLKSSTLTADITNDNIVIIEAGDKIRVVNFDAIWPMATKSAWSASTTGVEEKRIFNGDAALSSNILSMTSKPFASVLLTYFAPKVDPRMQRMIPQADVDHKKLSTLTKRLTEANFKVKHWNLAQSKPKAEPDDPKTQVMIVLPPPAGSAATNARHGAKQVRAAAREKNPQGHRFRNASRFPGYLHAAQADELHGSAGADAIRLG